MNNDYLNLAKEYKRFRYESYAREEQLLRTIAELRRVRMRHCPNCDGEVIVWDSDLQADKCIDCGESWSADEQEAVRMSKSNPPCGCDDDPLCENCHSDYAEHNDPEYSNVALKAEEAPPLIECRCGSRYTDGECVCVPRANTP